MGLTKILLSKTMAQSATNDLDIPFQNVEKQYYRRNKNKENNPTN